MNFRDPAANLVDDPAINPPLNAEKDEENEERAEDIRGNLEEAMERAAFQASEWTRNVVGRANIAVSSSIVNTVQQEGFSDETISEWIAAHHINSNDMSREEVIMAIRAAISSTCASRAAPRTTPSPSAARSRIPT